MSALARLCRSNATPEQLEAMRLRAWREHGVVGLRPEEVRDAWLKRALIDEAIRRYGSRPDGSR